jgi:hypothetical protein
VRFEADCTPVMGMGNKEVARLDSQKYFRSCTFLCESVGVGFR